MSIGVSEIGHQPLDEARQRLLNAAALLLPLSEIRSLCTGSAELMVPSLCEADGSQLNIPQRIRIDLIRERKVVRIRYDDDSNGTPRTRRVVAVSPVEARDCLSGTDMSGDDVRIVAEDLERHAGPLNLLNVITEQCRRPEADHPDLDLPRIESLEAAAEDLLARAFA